MSKTLLDLAARIENGHGIDRELDREIYWQVVCTQETRYRERDGIREVNRYHPSQGEDWRPYAEVNEPLITYSIDATEGLRRRVLPASFVEVPKGWERAYIFINPHTEREESFVGHHREEPRARLAALLRALASKEEVGR